MDDKHYLLRIVLKLAFFQNASVADASPHSLLLLSSCEPETWRHLFPFTGLFSSSFPPQSYTPCFQIHITLF